MALRVQSPGSLIRRAKLAFSTFVSGDLAAATASSSATRSEHQRRLSTSSRMQRRYGAAPR